MTPRRVAIAVTVAMLSLAGCVGTIDNIETQPRADTLDGVPSDVKVFTDDQRGVVCYLYIPGGDEMELSCVPLNQTTTGGGY